MSKVTELALGKPIAADVLTIELIEPTNPGRGHHPMAVYGLCTAPATVRSPPIPLPVPSSLPSEVAQIRRERKLSLDSERTDHPG